MSKTTINGDVHIQGELTKNSESVLVETSLFPSFDTTTSYYVGMIVTHLGSLYRCKTATSAGEWDATKWDRISTADIMSFKRIKPPASSYLTEAELEDFKHGVMVDGTFLSLGSPIFTPATHSSFTTYWCGFAIGSGTDNSYAEHLVSYRINMTTRLIECDVYYPYNGFLFDPISKTVNVSRLRQVNGKNIPDYQSDTTKSYALEQNVGGQLAWNEKIGIYVSITYADLKSLRDNAQLVPGTQYKITDFVTTTVQADTHSAGHQLDLIVVADSANKLNEQARAILHDGDTYFANSKLETWQVWYCLDNDTTRFEWADATNGKGVIYRMIDEFSNDCPYDFKNILFTRSGKYENAYTFSYTEDSIIKDASMLGFRRCHANVIKSYFHLNQQGLNFNVFYSASTTNNCIHNYIDDDSKYNTFGKDCGSNVLGKGCFNNTFGEECTDNVIDSHCSANTFGARCSYNEFGRNSNNNTFGNACDYNVFRASFTRNVFGYSCEHNVFGIFCGDNHFGKNCSYNTFGNNCSNNTFGNSSAAIDYCRSNIFDDGVCYVHLDSADAASSSDVLKNIHIHLGVQGASTSNPLVITVARNLQYSIDYYASNSQEVYL